MNKGDLAWYVGGDDKVQKCSFEGDAGKGSANVKLGEPPVDPRTLTVVAEDDVFTSEQDATAEAQKRRSNTQDAEPDVTDQDDVASNIMGTPLGAAQRRKL